MFLPQGPKKAQPMGSTLKLFSFINVNNTEDVQVAILVNASAGFATHGIHPILSNSPFAYDWRNAIMAICKRFSEVLPSFEFTSNTERLSTYASKLTEGGPESHTTFSSSQTLGQKRGLKHLSQLQEFLSSPFCIDSSQNE